jgi:transmembrane sensor
MSSYRNLNPEELASDGTFRNWALYNDPDARVFWEQWLDQNPDKLELVEKAKNLLMSTHQAFDKISDQEVAAEIYRLSHAIGENTARKASPLITFVKYWHSIAATLILMMGIGWYLATKETKQASTIAYRKILSEIKEPLMEQANLTNKPRLIVLEDGSSIVLQPHSKITFPAHFDGTRREVFLSGEAFFEVSKNPDKPFYVYASTLATKVLGTSFKISAFENAKDIKVVVKTGRVSVFPITEEAVSDQHAENKLGGMILTPNQQITFALKELRLTRSLVKDPKLLELPIQRQSFVFKATPIDEVFAAMEKSYGVKIVFDSEIMKNCYLTASLSDEPLFEKVDLICKTIGAQYEQMDASIIVTSKGCM